MIECGCIAGVMAWDGCEKNNVAAAVAASAAILTRVFIFFSLHMPGDTSVLHDTLTPWRKPKIENLVNISWAITGAPRCRSAPGAVRTIGKQDPNSQAGKLEKPRLCVCNGR
jgi:hypothetical protein